MSYIQETSEFGVGPLRSHPASHGQVRGLIYSRLCRGNRPYDALLIEHATEAFKELDSTLGEILSLIPKHNQDENGICFQDFYVRSDYDGWKSNADCHLNLQLGLIDDCLGERPHYQQVYRILLPYIIYNIGVSGVTHYIVGEHKWLITKLPYGI